MGSHAHGTYKPVARWERGRGRHCAIRVVARAQNWALAVTGCRDCRAVPRLREHTYPGAKVEHDVLVEGVPPLSDFMYEFFYRKRGRLSSPLDVLISTATGLIDVSRNRPHIAQLRALPCGHHGQTPSPPLSWDPKSLVLCTARSNKITPRLRLALAEWSAWAVERGAWVARQPHGAAMALDYCIILRARIEHNHDSILTLKGCSGRGNRSLVILTRNFSVGSNVVSIIKGP
ncbi:hypothetical protein EDB83DRAFT_2314324 [Lactarius deliciosus]|nr:hypothetical protein EDB83DRAFT_2314324 [Lactarius deliciosus]